MSQLIKSSTKRLSLDIGGIKRKCFNDIEEYFDIEDENLQNSELPLINTIKCIYNDIDNDVELKSLQISILIGIISTLKYSDTEGLLNSNKKELLINYIGLYCKGYVDHIYKKIYFDNLSTSVIFDLNNKIIKYFQSPLSKEIYFKRSTRLVSSLCLVISILDFIHKNSVYYVTSGNIFDFLNEVLKYDSSNSSFTYDKSPHLISKLPFFLSNKEYKFGCNCICRTLTTSILLSLYLKNLKTQISKNIDTINDLSHEDIKFAMILGSTELDTSNHIVLALFIGDNNDDRSLFENYIYFELTDNNMLSDNINVTLENIFDMSIEHYTNRNNMYLSDFNPVQLIITNYISYLIRPNKIIDWLKIGSNLINENDVVFMLNQLRCNYTNIFKKFELSIKILTNYKESKLSYKIIYQSFIKKFDNENKKYLEDLNKDNLLKLKNYFTLLFDLYNSLNGYKGYKDNKDYKAYKDDIKTYIDRINLSLSL